MQGGAGKSTTTLAIAAERAKSLNVALPTLPAQGQSREEDLRNALGFLHQSRNKIAPEIDQAHGRQAAMCLDLAMSSLTLQLIYQSNSPKLKGQVLDAIKRAGLQSGVPESYWQPVVEKAEAAAPFNEFTAAVRHMFENVPKHFAAKSNAPATAGSTSSSSAAAPTASQEIPRLVARLNQNYHRDMPEMHWSDDSIFDDGYIRKDHAVALEKDFTLVERYLECSIPEPSWRFGDNGRIPADYRMSAHSSEDCDKERHGLRWQEKTVQQPLAAIDPSSIGLAKTGKGDSGSDLRLTFGYMLDKFAIVSMSCKNRDACEQIAADLKTLVEIARNAATPGKTPSR